MAGEGDACPPAAAAFRGFSVRKHEHLSAPAPRWPPAPCARPPNVAGRAERRRMAPVSMVTGLFALPNGRSSVRLFVLSHGKGGSPRQMARSSPRQRHPVLHVATCLYVDNPALLCARYASRCRHVQTSTLRGRRSRLDRTSQPADTRATDVGETGRPAPKEQPPRKLSGQRTTPADNLWRVMRHSHPPTG